MRHRMWLAIVVLLMFASACADNTTQQVDETEETAEARPEDFKDGPTTEIVWQNTVADIEPVSRYREETGGPDIAHVTTVIALAEEADEEFRDFLDSLEGVESDVSDDGRLVTMRHDVEVPEDPDQDNRYTFTIEAPVEFARLQDDGDVSVTALLPRPAVGYQDGPTYDVELVSTDGEADQETFESEAEESQRVGVFWYKRGDPPWQAIYDLIG